MATIYPFPGLRYNSEKVDSPAKVIAPPYDVISEEEQENLYQLSPYNIIRLEYGKESTEDNHSNNRYTRAASDLNQWLEENILIQEDKPVFYWYEQQYEWEGQHYSRNGLIAALKTEPYENESVIPHEETLSNPKEDRLQLLRHCKTNFSPIFGLYPDKNNTIEEKCSFLKQLEPEMDFYDYSQQRHRLWIISDAKLQEQLQELFAPFTVFIADGHHRYETALQFSREMAAQGEKGYDRVLAVLVNLYSPGLLILPTHRVLFDIEQLNLENFISSLSNEFLIQEWSSPHELSLTKFLDELKAMGKDRFAFGMVSSEKVFALCVKDQFMTSEKKLDVVQLQEMVLEKQLGLTADSIKTGENLSYTRSAQEALNLVMQGKAQLSFILNPPGIDHTIQLAKTSQKLPQKSTYFFPKLITGLVLNKLD